MDALLSSRSASCLVSNHKLCQRSNGRTQYRTDRVSLWSSYSCVQTGRLASYKVADQQQLSSGKGRRSLGARAAVAIEEEGLNEAELETEEEVSNEANLATEEEGEDLVEDVAPTTSGSDEAVAQSVEVLKTAAKTRKVSASDISAAFKVLEKAKVDPADFLSLIGGKKSPGLTWLLIFTSSKEDDKDIQGGGKYFPITAVQNFDAEAMKIENGVYLGPLGELRLGGNFVWATRKLSFIFHTLSFKIGPLGPFSFGIGSKDKEITKSDPFFIWFYADDEIIVGKGRAGGTAFWVKCAREKTSAI